MNKKNNNKGFTLAELLIVVAIIAVLVAIAIPIFNTQLEKSREATDMANIRSAYAELNAWYLGQTSASTSTISVAAKQTQESWQTNNSANISIGTEVGGTGAVTAPAKVAPSTYSINISTDGTVSIS